MNYCSTRDTISAFQTVVSVSLERTAEWSCWHGTDAICWGNTPLPFNIGNTSGCRSEVGGEWPHSEVRTVTNDVQTTTKICFSLFWKSSRFSKELLRYSLQIEIRSTIWRDALHFLLIKPRVWFLNVRKERGQHLHIVALQNTIGFASRRNLNIQSQTNLFSYSTYKFLTIFLSSGNR